MYLNIKKKQFQYIHFKNTNFTINLQNFHGQIKNEKKGEEMSVTSF